MTILISESGQTLETAEGHLLTSRGPFQRSASGRNTIAAGSIPFAMWDSGSPLTLVGGRTISFTELYKSQPWVAAAVNKRSRPIVRLPLKVYELDSQGEKTRVRDHPLNDLLSTPWKLGSPAALKQAMFTPKLVHGNSLLVKERRRPGAPPRSFRPLDWRFLRPLMVNGFLEAWETNQFGQREWFAPDDVLHLHWWGPGGFGVSPLQQLGVTIKIEEAAQRYQHSYLERSARPPSALMTPEGVDEELRTEMRAEVDRLYAGPDNAGRPAVLPGVMKWEQIGHTAHEAELIEQRRLAREEVAAVYDMPPTLIGNLDKATYSNIDTQGGWLYTDILGPDLVLNEQEFKAQAIDPEPAWEGVFVEYDLAGVLRGDKLKEIQAIREAIGTAVLTPNEGRQVQNLPISGELDDENNPANKLYLPYNNLWPLGEPPAQKSPPADPASEAARAAALNGHQ